MGAESKDRLRTLFSNRDFLAYFVARETGWLAQAIADVAIGWQVFSLRHQVLDLGLIGLIGFLPQLLLAIPAGVLADRVDRKLICIAVAIVNFLCTIAFVTLSLEHATSVAVWFVALAVQAVSFAIGAPAQRSILPQIVRGTLFVRASALTSTFSQIIVIAGPALAGLLIAIGVPFAFAFAALSQFVSALGFFALRPRINDTTVREKEPLLKTALGGVRYVFENKVVLGAISLDLFAVLFGGATALLPVFATQILHVGAVGFGLLRAAPGAGAAVVAIFIARRPITHNGARWLFWCVAGFGAAMVVFGLSRSFWLSVATLAISGACDMVSMVIRNVLVQLRTPDAMRGRVSAVENIFIGASNELGAFESGAVASLIGAAPCVVLGGIATIVVIGTWALFFPALRQFDELTDT